MADNEIIKDLESITAYKSFTMNTKKILHNAIDLIFRQKAREKELTEQFTILGQEYDELYKENLSQKAEIYRLNLKIRDLNKERVEFSKMHWNDWEIHCNAIHEFAERLKKEALIESGFEVLQPGMIDNIVKEMTEGQG